MVEYLIVLSDLSSRFLAVLSVFVSLSFDREVVRQSGETILLGRLVLQFLALVQHILVPVVSRGKFVFVRILPVSIQA